MKNCDNCFYKEVEGTLSPCAGCTQHHYQPDGRYAFVSFKNWVDRSLFINEPEETKEENEVFNNMTEQLMKGTQAPTGIKYDQDKPRWGLLPFEPLAEVVAVLTVGAKKYAPDNWKFVPDADARYMDAAFRHIVSYMQGHKYDGETGSNHLAHAVCCLLFKLWFDRTQELDELYAPF